MELATQIKQEATSAAARALGITDQLNQIAEMAEALPTEKVASILTAMTNTMEPGTPDYIAGHAVLGIIK